MGKGYGKGGADKTLDVMRIFVIILNVFTSLAGLALIGLGIYALLRSDLLLAGKTVPITMIVAGALVFVVSFVGCVGAGVENKNMLTIASFFMIIITTNQPTRASWNSILYILNLRGNSAFSSIVLLGAAGPGSVPDCYGPLHGLQHGQGKNGNFCMVDFELNNLIIAKISASRPGGRLS
ncbi:hypothetical protein BC936DRAFT_139463 [Jimgerdemannia flammicorona]|uniref:Uncharacterized protein n=1 Tax=Jimgerdemannia flammicorona TaxID=994334 RepID=A0A433B9V4_9FUNG|nr:hypothetical protein BC936DRAFT_139463 [Jimgerdemannia flammicorona]